jgi:spore coat protein U-like protein
MPFFADIIFSRLRSLSAQLLGALFLLFTAVLLPTVASAQTCTVTGASGAYGNVDILAGAAWPSSTTFTATCTGTVGRTVRLCVDIGPGNNFGGVTSPRSLSGSTVGLTHELYTSGGTVVWGSWGAGTIAAYGTAGVQYDLVLTTSPRTTPPFTLVGKVLAAQQTVPPGSYTWNTGSPGLQYAYSGAAACPTGAKTALAGAGATVWTATILANCLISATNVDFGTVTSFTANTDATGSLSVRCTNGTPYNIGLNGGTSGATDPTLRKMANGAATVTYGLYRDAARSLPWGTTIGTNTISGTGSGLAVNQTVYGRIPPQTLPMSGTYTDIINVTVTY